MCGLGVAAALTCTAAAEPAVFVAQDADSTVYIYGTFHILKEGTEWMSPSVLRALKGSDTLFLEVDLAAASAGGDDSMAAFGSSPARPLSERLPPSEVERLRAAATRLGVPYDILEPLRPWLAAVLLARKALADDGFTEPGPDAQFALYAHEIGMPTIGFETAEEQFRLFGDLPPAAEEAMLASTLDDLEAGPQRFRSAAAAWLSGDLDSLADRAIGDIRAMGDEAYAAILVERNRRFAERIADEMAGSGTVFVAIGAAHLAGPDSVQAFLARKGIETVRLMGEAER